MASTDVTVEQIVGAIPQTADMKYSNENTCENALNIAHAYFAAWRAKDMGAYRALLADNRLC